MFATRESVGGRPKEGSSAILVKLFLAGAASRLDTPSLLRLVDGGPHVALFEASEKRKGGLPGNLNVSLLRKEANPQ